MVRFQEEYIEEIAAGCENVKIVKKSTKRYFVSNVNIFVHPNRCLEEIFSYIRRISWGDYDDCSPEKNSISSATGEQKFKTYFFKYIKHNLIKSCKHKHKYQNTE